MANKKSHKAKPKVTMSTSKHGISKRSPKTRAQRKVANEDLLTELDNGGIRAVHEQGMKPPLKAQSKAKLKEQAAKKAEERQRQFEATEGDILNALQGVQKLSA